MSLFSPDKILASFGVDPKAIMAEVEGFKSGMQQTILHFNTLLNATLANQARLESKLDALLEQQGVIHQPTIGTLIAANGKDHANG